MAVKIVRHPKKIALIGAPSSAAAFLAGSEKAPAALRAAGLVEKLQSAGFEVIDHGDCAPRLFADDEEHRRARNLPAIVAGLNDLKLRAEVAVKSGALVLVLGGDCAQVIGLLTGARRYYKNISLLWFDRDADLNTPASTPSGRIDGMSRPKPNASAARASRRTAARPAGAASRRGPRPRGCLAQRATS